MFIIRSHQKDSIGNYLGSFLYIYIYIYIYVVAPSAATQQVACCEMLAAPAALQVSMSSRSTCVGSKTDAGAATSSKLEVKALKPF